jgi:hypothetical protein
MVTFPIPASVLSQLDQACDRIIYLDPSKTWRETGFPAQRARRFPSLQAALEASVHTVFSNGGGRVCILDKLGQIESDYRVPSWRDFEAPGS